MVMQVLVLAVQNSVDYRNLGVATSGTTLFRSIGGSVGVALFGAVFAANLASGLAEPHARRHHAANGQRCGRRGRAVAGRPQPSTSRCSPRRCIRCSCGRR